MAGLQRSAVSFRRQGSSGLVWDDKFLASLVNQKEETLTDQLPDSQLKQAGEQSKEQQPAAAAPAEPIVSSRNAGSIQRSRSNGGGRGFRTGKVSPAIEPQSPKVSACGLCGPFAKQEKGRRRSKIPGGKRKEAMLRRSDNLVEVQPAANSPLQNDDHQRQAQTSSEEKDALP
nr:MAPK kinase substrate protein At1g80180 [Ipomoea batatas]